jgi:hypothetical protein
VRTTIDLPDELFRRIKARAALRGMKLKEYVTLALEDSLYRQEPAGDVAETEAPYGEESVALSEDCVLPLVSGETTEEMRSLTEKRIQEILEDEDVDDALSPG